VKRNAGSMFGMPGGSGRPDVSARSSGTSPGRTGASARSSTSAGPQGSAARGSNRVENGAARPAKNPWIQPMRAACRIPITALTETYESLVIGVADPYALRWIPVNTIIPGVFVGERLSVGRTLVNGDNLHPGDSGMPSIGQIVQWHHVSISVTNNTVYPVDAPVENPEQRNSDDATILKARVTLLMGNARTRTFDIDIGSGREFDVRCKAVESIVALVPDPTSLPPIRPAPLLAGDFRFATTIVVSIYCGCEPQGYRAPLSYTQAFFFGVGSAARFTMPVMSAAHEFEVSSTLGLPLVATMAMALYQPVVAMTTVDPAVIELSSFTADPGITQVRGAIPGNADIIIVSGSAPATAVEVVQLLNV